MTFLPQNNLEDPPLRQTLDPPDRVDEALQTADIEKLMSGIDMGLVPGEF